MYPLAHTTRRPQNPPIYTPPPPPLTHTRLATNIPRGQVLSNTVKQKRKEKAGKWDVPIPKVKPVADDEMFKVLRSGKRKGAPNPQSDTTTLATTFAFDLTKGS